MQCVGVRWCFVVAVSCSGVHATTVLRSDAFSPTGSLNTLTAGTASASPPPAAPPPPPPPPTPPPRHPPFTVTTLAGDGDAYNPGTTDGDGAQAKFDYPTGMCFTHDFSGLFIGDRNSGLLRRMDAHHPYTVTTVATVPGIWGVAATPDGLYVYATTGSGNIRETTWGIAKITLSDGSLSMLTTGLSYHRGMTMTSDGSTLYVADEFNGNIRRVDTTTGASSLIFSMGGCTTPYGVLLSADEATVYVPCAGSARGVYAYSLANNAVSSSVAFDGTPTHAVPGNPHGAVLNHDGSVMYVLDWGECEIFAVAMNGAALTTSVTSVAGQQNYNSGAACGHADGIGASAKLGRVVNGVLSRDGNTLYFTGRNAVRTLTLDLAQLANQPPAPPPLTAMVGNDLVLDGVNLREMMTVLGALGRRRFIRVSGGSGPTTQFNGLYYCSVQECDVPMYRDGPYTTGALGPATIPGTSKNIPTARGYVCLTCEGLRIQLFSNEGWGWALFGQNSCSLWGGSITHCSGLTTNERGHAITPRPPWHESCNWQPTGSDKCTAPADQPGWTFSPLKMELWEAPSAFVDRYGASITDNAWQAISWTQY